MTFYHLDESGHRIAYNYTPASEAGKDLPAVMFLGGFKSDMMGTKAQYLEAQSVSRGQEFIRFDYFGHGESDGDFLDGTMSIWLQNACDMLDHIVQSERVILVGSSMGGWLALLLMIKRTKRIHAMIGIAAAPDFTLDVEHEMNTNANTPLSRQPNGDITSYDPQSGYSYTFTHQLIKDAQGHMLLDKTFDLGVPMTLVQGKLDKSTEWQKAEKIKSAFGPDGVEIIYIEDGDHYLSRSQDLECLDRAVSAFL